MTLVVGLCERSVESATGPMASLFHLMPHPEHTTWVACWNRNCVHFCFIIMRDVLWQFFKHNFIRTNCRTIFSHIIAYYACHLILYSYALISVVNLVSWIRQLSKKSVSVIFVYFVHLRGKSPQLPIGSQNWPDSRYALQEQSLTVASKSVFCWSELGCTF